MSKGRPIDEMLKPLSDNPIQAYLGNGLHTLGLLHWILGQTGKADVWVSSYSTSEPFLNGFALMKLQGKVGRSMILLDARAVKKTLKLVAEMKYGFDHVFFGQNHSKIILVKNDMWQVAVVTSQNQTYGARAESTIITTDKGVFDVIMRQFVELAGNNSVELIDKRDNDEKREEFGRLFFDRYVPACDPCAGDAAGISRDESGAAGDAAHDTRTDWQPFGV